MKLFCKTVTLRTRATKNGILSYYLDYYPGFRDQLSLKTIRHETIGIYIYANPRNRRENQEHRGFFPYFLNVSTMRAIWLGMRICCGHFDRHSSQS